MLLGAAFVIELMGDGGDDAGLPGVPAGCGDLGERAKPRLRAVGGDDEPRPDFPSLVERQPRR